MRKRLIGLSFVLLMALGILFALAACRSGAEESLTITPTSASVISESTQVPTPTPIPTYAPGTELYGMLSVSGEVVIEPQYGYLDLFSDEGLARFEAHGLWGFVNEQGVEVIPAKYEGANNFSEGMTAVKVDGVWGFIDTTGRMVIEPQFEGVDDGFHFDRCIVDESGQKGLIDTKGNVIVEPIYTSIVLTSNNYFIVSNTENEYGIIDRDGKIAVDFQDGEIDAVTDKGYYFIYREHDITSTKSIKFDLYDMLGNHFISRENFRIDFDNPLIEVNLVEVSEDGIRFGLLI